MIDFRTILTVRQSESKINLQTPILTTGSCFADAIGGRLQKNKFKVLSNPFGAVYNPVSIHKTLMDCIRNFYDPDKVIENDGLFYHYDYHSQWTGLDSSQVSTTIQQQLNQTHHFLKSIKWILITYGTSWVYSLKEKNEIVANCHKVPALNFYKNLLTIEDIQTSFNQLKNELKNINAGIRIILTVSPVRHIKDTIELNSVSKSILRTACHYIAEKHGDVEYFPAYEMMMDDLRDYRFYKSDMIHPTEQAEDYIWKLFSEKYFDNDTHVFLKEWSTVLSGLQHKAFNPQSEKHRSFIDDLKKKLIKLGEKVDISKELKHLETL